MSKVTVQSQYSNLAGVYALSGKKDQYVRADNATYLYKVEGQGWVFSQDVESDKFFVKCDEETKFPWQAAEGSYGEAIESVRELAHKDASKFPKRLYVQSKYGNIDGGYTLLDDLYEEYPAYENKEDGLVLWHSAINGNWKITPAPVGNKSCYAFCKGDCADASKLDCSGFANEVVTSIETVKFNEDAAKNEGKYVDNKFLPTMAAIGDENITEVEWVRATDMNRDDKEALFYMIEPTDLLQGSVGDCWLIASLAALAEFPQCVKRLFVSGHEVSKEGKYGIQLYDVRRGGWATMEIDDLIPCRPRGWWSKSAEPHFAKVCGNELWAILLEKAFARFVGSYGALSGGHTVWAWQCLTGVEEQITIMKNDNGSWDQYRIDVGTQKERMEGGERRACPLCRRSNDPTYDNNSLFEFLKECDQKQYMMSSGIRGKEGEIEHQRTDGLVEGHAYSLLKVVEVDGNKLVELRNPWGNSKEWNGSWSDASSNWEQNPNVAVELDPKFKPDGAFWMAFGDFARIFSSVNVCPVEGSPLDGAERLPTIVQTPTEGMMKPFRTQLAAMDPAIGALVTKLLGCGAKK